MTILYTMTLVGLLGLALHMEWYWMAGGVAALFLFSILYTRRRSRTGA